MTDLGKTVESTIVAVKKAAGYISGQLNGKAAGEVDRKGLHDYVTTVDRTAEALLVEELQQIVPEAGFVTEEGTATNRGRDWNWIIDPLDGTTNFIHGAFPFAVSVALTWEGRPVAGLILEIGRNECFYAWQGGGAWMNNTPISVSSTKKLNDSLVATGFPYTNFDRIDAYMETMMWFMKNSRGLRRLGSAATDIAWVACGRYDGFYEYGLNAWDVAAGIIILQEAGGKAADFAGGENYLDGREIICSNGHNHDEFVQALSAIMLKK